MRGLPGRARYPRRYGRYHDGNMVILANSVKGEKETFKKHRSTEWVLNADQTISTCRKPDFVLGVRIADGAAADGAAAAAAS